MHVRAYVLMYIYVHIQIHNSAGVANDDDNH